MKRVWILAAALVLPFGCGEDTPTTVTCPEGNMVGGVCAGVPAEALCGGDSCAASCGQVFSVKNEAELADAVASAGEGDCLALAPGKYGAIELPSGVSVYGTSAAEVSVSSIRSTGGDVSIKALTVKGGSVTIDAGNGTLDGLRILESTADGVTLAAGASATVSRSEITRSANYGVSAFDVNAVSLSTTIIDDSAGPGIWMHCTGGCACSTTVNGTLSDSVIRGNAIVGVSIIGASVTMTNVEVSDTTVGQDFTAGGGVSASGCSVVNADRLSITNSDYFGFLVDDSSVTLSNGTVDNNLRGLWIQHIGQSMADASVTVTGSVVRNNLGVGIGLDGQSTAVTISNSEVSNTAILPLPVVVGGVSASVQDVGDGIAWLDLSHATIDNVTISNSARASVLIDGAVAPNSSISNLLQANGDETLGILQQNLEPGGLEPNTSGTTPAVNANAGEVHAIPEGIPPSI